MITSKRPSGGSLPANAPASWTSVQAPAPKAPTPMPNLGNRAGITPPKPTAAKPAASPTAARSPQPSPGPTGLAAIAQLPPAVQQGLARARQEAERQVNALHMRAVAGGDQQWAGDKTERLILELIQGGRNAGQMENDVERRLGRQLGGGQPPVGGTPGIPFGAPSQPGASQPGATAAPRPPQQPQPGQGNVTPEISQDPSYLAYERLLASQQADLEAGAARQGDAVSRRLAFQLPQFDWQAQGLQRVLAMGMEDRGILRAGQHERTLAEMMRDQTASRGALELDAGEQLSGIEYDLARQIADIARRRQEAQLDAANRRYMDAGMSPYRVS